MGHVLHISSNAEKVDAFRVVGSATVIMIAMMDLMKSIAVCIILGVFLSKSTHYRVRSTVALHYHLSFLLTSVSYGYGLGNYRPCPWIIALIYNQHWIQSIGV